AVLGEAFRAVAALEQERLALGNAAERLHQVARLTGKNERREGRELLLDFGQSLLVRIIRHLQSRLLAPALGRPTLGHDAALRYAHPRYAAGKDGRISAAYTRPRVSKARTNLVWRLDVFGADRRRA